jgi:cation diffusion facilitator CzcD-associated flavoprotein CzcO
VPSATTRPLPEETAVAIVGAGFGGLGMAIGLRQQGIEDFVVLERAALVGTGATAIQVGPQIRPKVQRLHVFQRTAPWISPTPIV